MGGTPGLFVRQLAICWVESPGGGAWLEAQR